MSALPLTLGYPLDEPSPRESYGVIEAEFGLHLLGCESCDIGTSYLCLEGGRLADEALAAGTAVHVAEGRGW